MINLDDNEILLRCSCYSPDHIAFLVHEQWSSRGNNLKAEDDDWYLSIMLDPIKPWWKRAWRAFFPCKRYGQYAEIVLTNQDVQRLADFIKKRLENAESS